MAWIPKKCVVVPVDFTEDSFSAVDTALELVDQASHVHVVHVGRPLSAVEPAVMWDTVSNEERLSHIENSLKEHLAERKYDEVQPKVFMGNPGMEIVSFAESVGADLIVMPSHGRTGLKRITLGSVAERVVRMAHCPVLILRH